MDNNNNRNTLEEQLFDAIVNNDVEKAKKYY
jgi:hypothetical protein